MKWKHEYIIETKIIPRNKYAIMSLKYELLDEGFINRLLATLTLGYMGYFIDWAELPNKSHVYLMKERVYTEYNKMRGPKEHKIWCIKMRFEITNIRTLTISLLDPSGKFIDENLTYEVET